MSKKKKRGLGKSTFIILAILCFTEVGLASDPWMGNRVDITDSIVISHPNHPEFNYCCFTVHEVNPNGSSHLAYTFYLIADPELGDVNGIMDYNINGCHPDLNLNAGNTGGSDGSYPGRHLKWAVNLVNYHYDSYLNTGVENGEAVFCILGGDLAVSAEKAESQHADRKLRMLHLPWVPVIGNHDTWPYADIYDSWNSDYYFQAPSVFGYRFTLAEDIFPNWEKQPLPPGVDSSTTPATRCQNWVFDMGSNHHLGLDFTQRSLGGGPEPRATLHDNTNGTWPWFCNHLDNMGSDHERLIIAAHHPLDFPPPGLRRQFSNSEAEKIINEINNHESEVAYWFSGHEHADPDDYWAVGPATNDTVIEVHFNSGTNRGGSDDNDFHIALVKVYSDYVCDFTVSPNPVTVGIPVEFTSTSHFYSGPSIAMYYWDFGDGSGTHGTSSNEISHTYTTPGNYWAKHWVRDASDSQRSYMIRKVIVDTELSPPHLRVVIKPPLQPLGGLMSYLDPGGGGGGVGDYLAYLDWTFYPVQPYPYTFDSYTGGRVAPNNNPFIYWPHATRYAWADDPQYLFIGNLYTWRVNANLKSTIAGDTTLYDYASKDLRDDPEPSGGCPEVWAYSRCDTIEGNPIHTFISENTILPHSEHAKYAGQVRMDLLKLEVLEAYADHYLMYILENDDETSYIDELKLWVVDHPLGTEVVTSSNGNIYVYSENSTPLSCQDNLGTNCYNEIVYQDDTAYLGNNSSYLTVTFPNNYWPRTGLVLGTGFPSEFAEVAPIPKNYLGIPNKPDGEGGWIPLGEAFARKDPSLWLFDVSDVVVDTFRIDCEGDSCYIDYVGLVKFEDSGWTDTTVSPTTALHWYQVGGQGGEWQSSDETAKLLSIDDSTSVLSPSEQLAVMFPAVPANPDTSMVRDYVLESYGVYFSEAIPPGSPGVEEKEPVFTYSFGVKQVRPFSRTATISYQVPRSTHVSLVLYDASGRLVKSFVDEEITPGKYSISWDGTDSKSAKVSSGAYFVRIKAGSFLKTQKLVILE